MRDPAPEPGKEYFGMEKRIYTQMFPSDGRCFLQYKGTLVMGKIETVTNNGELYIRNISKHIDEVKHINYFLAHPKWVFNDLTIMEFLN